MANRTITANFTGYNGITAGVQFTNSTATVDDATVKGKRAIAFARRHGWAVSGGAPFGATAVPDTVEDGKPYTRWTRAELETYLDDLKVQYPSGASDADLLAAVKDAFETKGQGGSAANESGGFTSGSAAPIDGNPGTNPEKPDDAEKVELWSPPVTGVDLDDVAPVFTTQPAASPKTAGATATYTVVVTGTPAPSIQWQRQTRGAGAYADIEGATAASYTTPALSVAENNGDRYRAVASNSDGKVTSTSVQQVVNA